MKRSSFLVLLFFCLTLLVPFAARAEDPWFVKDADGTPQIQLYFFWSLTCPHCTAAHPYIEAIARSRPWAKLHALELSRHPENVRKYESMARALGEEAVSVPAWLFCGEMHVGWGDDETTGATLRQRLDDCRARVGGGVGGAVPAAAPLAPATAINLPLIGALDPARLSLPALTLVLAGLDAFNPCAFFVLLFLLSMMAHQKSRTRMLVIGGVFVAISGLMYFAFMAAWLNVFQLFGHLAWVTLAAGALAVFVGAVSVKDYFWFEKGLTLSIPESKKPDIFRRTRSILSAENMPAMIAATAFLAIAANFYELLCTAGFPMVYTRLLTLADLSPAARYGYLAFYNLIYVVPLAVIVAVFAGSLGARKLTEREGRLLKLMSGVMMLELGALLLLAPERVSQAGIAFGLLAVAVGITFIAARFRREE
ncbi:MAG: cytochrome c bioproteinis protein transmembrane region [Rhodocyclaceae bacterium]|nr:MAG: cytochrome c bioproteinis protein transmembrane region [Rhodocyclaceae bacterium]TND06140.1 MAG: cytochrome c bioproteinis protein transmembrane region [Rhodocyclaceae bacterium]